MTTALRIATAVNDPALSPTSADEAIDRFNTASAAAKYAASLGGTAVHRREMACILQALAGVKAGSTVLDIPCGTGRLLPELTAYGYQVTAVDVSAHMLGHARTFAAIHDLNIPDERFMVASVLNTGFSEGAFDAVVCNRLFHHFREPAVRRQALRELGRISRGPVVASFFSSLSLDGAWFRVRDAMRAKGAIDRIPIAPRAFRADVHAAGLRVTRWLQTRPGVSKQWYAVCERA